MKASDVQRLISIHPENATRAESVAVALRAEALLPKGGRGLHAPEISSEEAVTFLIAFAACDRVADASKASMKMAGLVNSEGKALLDVLTSIVRNDDLAGSVRRVLLIPVAEKAEIHWDSGTVSDFLPPLWWAEHAYLGSQHQGATAVGQIGVIGGAIIHQLAIDLHEGSEMEGELAQ